MTRRSDAAAPNTFIGIDFAWESERNATDTEPAGHR